jgi:hypothetical protein
MMEEQTNKSPESKDSYKGRMAIGVSLVQRGSFLIDWKPHQKAMSMENGDCAVMTEQRMQGMRELQC